MPCPPLVPISIIPPVSQGPSPILWQNGNQITRLNTPLNPSWLVYDGTNTRWGDGSAQAPIYLPNIQEVNGPSVTYVAGITESGQVVKTIGASGTALIGGVAGSVVYQSAPSVTGFTAAGTTGQLLSSNGASAPTWLNQSSITAGSVVDGAITNAKIANGAVTPAKLSTGGPSWDAGGNLNVSASIQAVSAIQSNDGTTNNRVISSGGVAYIGSTTNHPVVVQTNNTEKMRIAEDGNVGIGTSLFNYASTGRTCLEVNGSESIVALKTGNIGKAYLFTTSGIASLATDQIPIAIATTGNNYIKFTTNGVGRFFINGNGTMDAQGNIIANCPTTASAWGGGSSAGVINPTTYGVSTITRTALGNYLVTMSTAINGYSVVATPDSSVSYQASAAIVSTTQFRVYTFGASGAAQDAAFKFAVFGF